MFKRIFSAALVFGAAAMAPPAQAQMARCMPRPVLVETLEANYAEHLTGGGLQSPQQLLEIWTSEKSGSFTVFITRPDGISCIMATGQNWNNIEQKQQNGVAG